MTEQQQKVLNLIASSRYELSLRYPADPDDLDFMEEPVYEAVASLWQLERSVYDMTIVGRVQKKGTNGIKTITEYSRNPGETPREVARKFNANVEDLININGGLDAFYASSSVRVPVPVSGIVTEQFEKVPTFTESGGEELLGTDITRTFNRRNVGTEEDPLYDLDTYSGYTNLQQGIAHRLRTEIGNLPYNKQFGLLRTVVSSPAEVRDSMNAIAIDRTVMADARILEISDIRFNGARVEVDAIPITKAVNKSSTATDNFFDDPAREYILPPPPELEAPSVTFIESYPSL
ncbi:MAG: hypothetical protein HUU10_04545 [Bacteroidetes bacterium]|nr:hypothetical protein [Bacteroidota bacterium]